MAKRTVDDSPLSVSQAATQLGDSRRDAARTIATSALGLLGCNACEVYLYDEQADAYLSAGLASDSEDPGAGVALPGPAIAAMFPDGSDVLAIDDARSLGEPLKRAVDNFGAASALLLRASSEHGPLGLIICAYRWSRHLSAAGATTPTSFTRIASSVLDLARRNENALDRADRLAALLDSAARFAGELDLEELFAAIHEEVSRHMDSPSFYVALESGESRELRTEYAIESGVRFHSDALPGRKGLAAQVHQSGRPALVEWADMYDTREGQASSAGSVLMVPMRLGERIIGVMSTQSKRPNAYSQHHVEFLV